MSLTAAKSQIASFAARLVAELAATDIGRVNRGGAQSMILDAIHAEFDSKPARANLRALYIKLTGDEISEENVTAWESQIRREIVAKIIAEVIDMEQLVSGFAPEDKRHRRGPRDNRGALANATHRDSLRAGEKRAENVRRAIERARG